MKADKTIGRHGSAERTSLVWPTIWKNSDVDTACIVRGDENRRREALGPFIVVICLDARRVLLLQPFERGAFDRVAPAITPGLRQR
jgi:hypothetical protein